ncbi:hypothetical protein R5R35_012176 [Gryllus longicercus]|uniref:DNA polymerase epsilon subunit 3 n=1 Tax=Gryllus longicercus TaxID=2509291 RepID=A0AAN9VZB9_9ORTH
MAQSFDDLNLPNAVVTRIAKEVLPENVSIGKEARTALAKAASVFVLYITSASNALATKNNRKTINGLDVIEAMHETDFHMFVEHLKENLEYFKKIQQEKKDAVVKQKLQKDGESNCAASNDNADENDIQ